MALAAPFIYNALSSGQFRILHLDPGNRDDSLQGKLVVAAINDLDILYDALSYMWGDPEPAGSIVISGQLMPIASNLATALYHLRCNDRPLIIWIDAICINQNDNVERAEQVHLMRQLYSHASTVHIWINESNIDSDSPAVRALQTFHNVAIDEKGTNYGLGHDPSFWEPVAPIFANEYWSRAWIQQEVLNARHISLHCMDTVIPGASVGRFQEATSRRRNEVSWHLAESDRAWVKHLDPFLDHASPAARDLLDYQKFGHFWTLCQLLSIHAGRLHMADPRDRVYALMHLADDYEDGGVVVDYSKSLVEVVVDAATYHVRRNSELTFLLVAHLEPIEDAFDTKENVIGPTWLPRLWYDQSSSRSDTRATRYDARTKCAPNAIFGQRLQVRGIKLDRVKSCLTLGLDFGHMTARQFCESLLGLYLRVFAGVGMRKLSLEVFKVLVSADHYRLMISRRLLESQLGNPKASSNPQNVDISNEEKLITARYEATISALAIIFEMRLDQRYADEYILTQNNMQSALVQGLDLVAKAVLSEIVIELFDADIIMTETKKLGRVPKCAIQDGDEIWVVLGCPIPIVLRPKSNDTYWHACAAEIPSIQENADIEALSSDVRPGDKVGEWTVADIILE